MKHSMLLIHPKQFNETTPKNENIFEKSRMSESLPSIHKSLILDRSQKLYDFVGPTQFKLKKFFPGTMRTTGKVSLRTKDNQESLQKKQAIQLQETTRNFSKMANTTINRETILSKLTRHEQIQATKQRRNIDRYKEYQDYWGTQANQMKRLINKKRPSLVESSQNVIVQDNPDKQDIINNHIVHYWQMSLRNHNPILKRHIKGHKFDQVQLEEKLQMHQGIKQVQASIPKLPLEVLKKIKTRDLSLTGRSKALSESQTLTERSSFVPISSRDVLNQEEVYRISYQGDKKWQGTQNFY